MRLISLLLLLLAAPCLRAQSPNDLVLVAPTSSTIEVLTASQIRRAFMGLTVSTEQATVKPLINISTPSLRTAFLQHVIGMSELMYRKRQLSLALQQGVAQPPQYEEHEDLVSQLRRMPGGITFMWRSEAQRTAGIRILRVLWEH